MQTGIIFNQILILGILVVIGVAGAASGALKEEAKDTLAGIIFNITLPLMLFTNFSKMDATSRLLSNSISMMGLSFGTMMLMLLIGWVTSRLLNIRNNEAPVFITHSIFGNIIYLGFPVVYALFGDEGLLYASMLQLVSNILMWTLGVVMLSSGKGVPVFRSMLRVFNINTYAIVAGLIMFIAGIKLPAFLMIPFDGLGGANTYLSMIYIGLMLYYSNIRNMAGKKIVYFLTFNKLLLVPIILMGLLLLLPGLTGIKADRLVFSVLIVESSMPCMANIIILAKTFGADDELATANVFISTLFSIITLPFIIYIMNRWF